MGWAEDAFDQALAEHLANRRSSRWAFQPIGLIGLAMAQVNRLLIRCGVALGFGPISLPSGRPASRRSFSIVRWP